MFEEKKSEDPVKEGSVCKGGSEISDEDLQQVTGGLRVRIDSKNPVCPKCLVERGSGNYRLIDRGDGYDKMKERYRLFRCRTCNTEYRFYPGRNRWVCSLSANIPIEYIER